MTREGLFQCRDGSRRLRQKSHKLLLSCSRQANDLDLGHGLLRRFPSGSDDEFTDGTSLDFSSTSNDGKRLGRDARFKACGPVWVLLRHGNSSFTIANVRHFAVQVKDRPNSFPGNENDQRQ